MTDERAPRSEERTPRSDDRGLEEVSGELNRYTSLSDADPSPGFVDRVMSAVEASPAPRRAFFASLARARRMSRTLQLAAAAAILVVVVAGTFAGGQLAGWLRQSASPVSTPTTVASPSPTPTPSVTPSERATPSPSPEATASQEGGGTVEPGASSDHGGPTPGLPGPSEDGGSSGTSSDRVQSSPSADH